MKSKKQQLLPVVSMTFQDHSAHLEGKAEPYKFLAIGIVYKETTHGYYLAHWLDVTKPGKLGKEITTYIAKVKGLKISVLTHICVDNVE